MILPSKKILFRNGRILVIYYKRDSFWIEELNPSDSLFLFSNETQKKILKFNKLPNINDEKRPFRFPSLDGFDVNQNADMIIFAHHQKCHLFNLITSEHEIHQYNHHIKICRFRTKDYFIFLESGECILFSEGKSIRNHWHYSSPISVTFTDRIIYSGGFEGVLMKFTDTLLKRISS